MQKKRIIIEYCFVGMILATLLDSIFVGFSATTYRFLLIAGMIGVFALLQRLFHMYKVMVVSYVVLLVGGIIVVHSWISNGFYLIYNRIVQQINSIFDMGFYYYIDVSIEEYQRDVFAFLIVLLLILNLLIHFSRKHMKLCISIIAICELVILVLSAYNITSSFFLFLCSMFGYTFYHQRKNIICLVGCVLLGLFAVFFLDIQGQSIENLSLAKEQAIEKVRDISQGSDYAVSGGIGEGDMRTAQKIEPKGTRLFDVTTISDKTLYLKGFVSGSYGNNHWNQVEKNIEIVKGNNAISLPYLFFNLQMDDFMKHKTATNAVEGETDLTFDYKKLNDKYYLWPYFSDIDINLGKVSGDTYMTRANIPMNFSLTYYPIDSVDSILKSNFDAMERSNMGALEYNYIESMDEYGAEVKKKYLAVPDDLRENIAKKFPELKNQKTIYEKVTYVQKLLLNEYQYTLKQSQVPKGEDSIWYFLNKTKKGYCVLYASSAVMMYRMMGIPTRYVEGYKIDQSYFEKNDKVKVTDQYAHAWPEIYIENLGWIPIEVTNVKESTPIANKKTVIKKEKKDENVRYVLKKIDQGKEWIMLTTFVLFLIHGMVCLIRNILWHRKSNKEKVSDYYDLITNTYEVETAEIKDSIEMEIFLKAKYSPYEIENDELNIIKRYVKILRKKI